MTYERENIAGMSGYVPGEQPESSDLVKLNTNENPYPPGEAVMAALRGTPAEALRKYPPHTARGFCEVAGNVHGVSSGRILATNAGDELLRLVITTFVEPGRPIGAAEPSYSLYPVLAAIHDSPVHRVPREDDWSLPGDFAERMNVAGVPLVFVVNPHAPSGRLAGVDQLAGIADQLNGVLVVDEAYVDFVDPDLGYDGVELVRQHENVILLRTLSKGYSLAGLRFGYGIASEGLIEPLLKTKDSYNTDAIAQRLARAALEHRDEAAATWRKVRDERARVAAALAEIGFEVPVSQSNFVLATVPAGFAGGARSVYESLKRGRIFVRYFEQDRLRDKLRITIGTPEQNNALLDALRAMG